MVPKSRRGSLVDEAASLIEFVLGHLSFQRYRCSTGPCDCARRVYYNKNRIPPVQWRTLVVEYVASMRSPTPPPPISPRRSVVRL